MDNTLFATPPAEEAAKIEAEIVQIFAQMDRIDERIAKDHEETIRLRNETRKILEQIKVR